MIAHKGKLGAVLIALTVSSPAWAHMDKTDKCGDISSVYGFAVNSRNEGVSPHRTYREMKSGDVPNNFRELFASKQKERQYLKHVVNQAYFDQRLQRTTSNQVSHAVLNNCMGWGSAKWHRLKTH